MAKPFGSPKTGGRRKGTPNKKTQELEKSLKAHGVDVVAQISELLPKLEVEKRVDVLLNMMNYLFPKRKALEIEEEPFAMPDKIEIHIIDPKNEGTPKVE